MSAIDRWSCFTLYVWDNIVIALKQVSAIDRWSCFTLGARCSSVVRAFAHGAMGHRIDPAWGGPIELFLVPASAPRLV